MPAFRNLTQLYTASFLSLQLDQLTPRAETVVSGLEKSEFKIIHHSSLLSLMLLVTLQRTPVLHCQDFSHVYPLYFSTGEFVATLS